MAESTINLIEDAIFYPDSDGEPMGENDWHIQFIFYLHENLKFCFRDRSDKVYVASDLFWYPVEGDNKVVQAPDAMVVLGRPQVNRRCYKQWEEDNMAPAVTFEVDSPSKRKKEAQAKLDFYERYGVQEHYEFDVLKDPQRLKGWLRSGDKLKPIPDMENWVSPSLGIKFTVQDGQIVILHPDGEAFLSGEEFRNRVVSEEQRAIAALHFANAEKQKAEDAMAEVEKLKQQLRDAGIDPEQS